MMSATMAARRALPNLSRQLTKNLSSKATVPTRKIVTPKERAILRAARKQQAAQIMKSQNKQNAATAGKSTDIAGSASIATVSRPMDSRLVFGLGAGIPTILLAWGISDEDSPPAQFAKMIGFTNHWENFTDQFSKPIRSKLLPDWASMNVPPGMPPPHTLVLDLENTLVSSTWDRKRGWRHAKRPGVDKFLTEMSQYFEIVIYSPSHEGIAEPVISSLDKNSAVMHRLYRDACHYKNGVYMKDLSALNRNLGKIVLLDDDERAAALNPDHHIKVKPYDDPKDRNDTTLERITPLLIEIATEGHNIPEVLHQFKGMDADQIADEHAKRVIEFKTKSSRSAQKGLGAFASMGRIDMPEPEMTPVPERSRYKGPEAQQALTSKDLVGSDPGDNSKGSRGISGWMQKRQEQRQKEEMEKMQHWQEVMAEKNAQKERRAQEAVH